jgi:hypothetical protein
VVPFACVLAMPTIWIQSSALLLASLALYRDRAWFAKPAEVTRKTEVSRRMTEVTPA